MNKERELQLDALDYIEERISYGFTGEWADLTSAVFYLNYYESSYSESEEILNELGTFDILKEIKKDEESIYGETKTDFTDAVDVLNAYFVILGEGLVGRLAAETSLRNIQEEYKEEILNVINTLREEVE